MITAEQVKNLNKKIEQLNAQGTKAKGKLEVLEGNLQQAIQDYSSLYGVNLSGKTMKATAANIQKELKSVESAVQAEFELREKVVAAIERGDIDEANRLLGVEVVEEVEEEPEEVYEPAEEAVDEEDEGVDFGADVYDAEDDEVESFGFSGLDFGDLSIDEDETSGVVPKSPSKPVEKKSSSKSAPVTGTPANNVVEDMEGDFGDFDLSEDDFEDFGFGSMLSGTKFSLDD